MKTSYIISQVFIQAGLLSFAILLLPYLGFIVGVSFFATTTLVGVLATTKVLLWILLRGFLGLSRGFLRDVLIMMASSFFTLFILSIFGLAVLDTISWLVLFGLLIMCDIFSHALLMSAGARKNPQ